MAQIYEQDERRITPFDDEELAFFKNLLLEKRAEAEEEMGYLKESLRNLIESEDAESSSNAHHMADVATDEESVELFYRLIGRTRNYIHQLNRALERVENKTYGICKATGKPISRGRLEAVPHTRYELAAKVQGLDNRN